MNDELFVLVKILSCLVLFYFLSMNPSFFLQLARIPDGVRSVLNLKHVLCSCILLSGVGFGSVKLRYIISILMHACMIKAHLLSLSRMTQIKYYSNFSNYCYPYLWSFAFLLWN